MFPPIGNGRLLGVELWPKSNSGLRGALLCPVPILLLTERGGLLGRSRIVWGFFFFLVFPIPDFTSLQGALMGENFGFCGLLGLVKPLSGGPTDLSRSGVCGLGSGRGVGDLPWLQPGLWREPRPRLPVEGLGFD